MVGDNEGSILNADNSMTRFISPRWICFLAVALLFLSGRSVNADPVGDFFKKVGQSVSKAFQPYPTPNPTEKKTKRAARRPNPRNLTATEASATPVEEPTAGAKEENVTPAAVVLRA